MGDKQGWGYVQGDLLTVHWNFLSKKRWISELNNGGNLKG